MTKDIHRHQPEHKTPVAGKIIAACLLLGFVTAFSFYESHAKTGTFNSPNHFTSLTPGVDTFPTGDKKKVAATTIYSNDRDKIILETENGQTKRLNVNGKEIPKEEFGKYEGLVRQIHQGPEQSSQDSDLAREEADEARREAAEAKREAEQAAIEAKMEAQEAKREAGGR